MPKTRGKRSASDFAKQRIRVGAGRVTDRLALVALENRCFSGDRLSARQWARHLTGESARVLVARDASRLLGAAVLFFRSGSDIARLYSLATDPDARGLGLGRALLQACEQAARRSGCTRMRLEVRKDNQAAQRLYLAHGYKPIGQRPSYYEDGEDALRFEKLIAAA